jgi:hypothetical protein
LHKCFKDPLLIFLGDPNSGVLHLENQPHRAFVLGAVTPQAQGDRTGFRIADRVSDQIDQHLAEFVGIGSRVGREVCGPGNAQFEMARFGPHAEHVGDVLYQSAQIARRALNNHPSGLDLRQIQHVVDQSQQVLAASIDDIQVSPLRVGEAGLLE